MTLLTAAWTWIVENHVLIYTTAVLVLNSLINGLTPYPNVETFLGKVQHWVGLFAFLTHVDSPGTLKVPFTHSKEPVDVGTLQELKPPKGHASLKLLPWLVLVAGALTLINCAWFQKTGGPDALNCAKQQVPAAVNGAVMGAISGGASNALTWETELDSLAVNDVVCTLTAWVSSVEEHSGGAALSPNTIEGMKRAQQWLKAHGQG